MAAEWLSCRDASDLWNRCASNGRRAPGAKEQSPERVRRYCREGTMAQLGVEVMVLDGRYYVKRADLLVLLRCVGIRAAVRCSGELELPLAQLLADVKAVWAAQTKRGDS